MPVKFDGDGALLVDDDIDEGEGTLLDDDDIDGDDDPWPVNFGDGAFDDLGDGATAGAAFDV